MKKKGILLLGSLAVMVVAMVFIAVTLISRASVTPETSDAATPKKKVTVSVSSKGSTQIKYNLQLFEHTAGNESFVNGMNDNGVTTGIEYVNHEAFPGVIWDEQGKYIKTLYSQMLRSVPVNVNNNGQVIGMKWKPIGGESRQYAYIYDLNTKEYSELETIPFVGYNLEKSMLSRLRPVSSSLQQKKSLFPKMLLNRNTSEILASENSTFDWTFASKNNNQNDIVGVSNFKAVLWLKAGKKTHTLVNLDNILKNYVDHDMYMSKAFYLTDEKNGIIKILGDISYVNDPNDDVFLMDYSAAENKVVKVKILQASVIGEYNRLVSRGITDDGSILVGAPENIYYLSPKDDYTSKIKLTDIFLQNGYRIDPDFDSQINGKGIIAGTVYWYERPWPYGDLFIANVNTGKLEIVRHLVEKGEISGIPANTTINGFGDINEKGEMSVNLYQDGETFLTGKLIPVK